MDRLMRMMGMGPNQGGAPGLDSVVPDTAETTQVSPVALLKMLKHARAGVPMEIMGLMLGEYIDEYTIKIVDVFAMPQSGNSVSVEAVDPVFQQRMMEMLKTVNRGEIVVGWYHSHPGFGCWLSNVDINTAQSFEKLHARSVALVVDPIQSVRGKVVMDAFRTISPQAMMLGLPPRQTTSNLGHINRPSIQALVHGLGRMYYSMPINSLRSDRQMNMIKSIRSKLWHSALDPPNYVKHAESTTSKVQSICKLSTAYVQQLDQEIENDEKREAGLLSSDNVVAAQAGRVDARKHLSEQVDDLMADNVNRILSSMLNSVAF